MQTVGFIGGGRVTRILLRGWARAGIHPGRVTVHEPDAAAFARMATWVPPEGRVPLDALGTCDIVFVALHPPHVGPALGALGPSLRRDTSVVSLAPSITLGDLATFSGTPRVARVIPNAASIVGRGFNPVTFAAGLPADARKTLAALFQPLGQFPEVHEGDLEAYAVLTGMGPTYFWPQWQALREIARECGLSQEAADRGLRAMVGGAMGTLLDSGLSADEVVDLIPVKPLAGQEASVVGAYRAVLPALYKKIAPAAKAASASR